MMRGIRILAQLALLAVAGLTAGRAGAQAIPFVAVYQGYSSSVNAVALSPDGRQMLSGGHDNVLRLWDTGTGLLLRTFDAQTASINAVAFSPDGRQILTAGDDNRVRLWDVVTGQPIEIMFAHAAPVTSAAFSPDGRQVLSGSRDKTLKLWDTASQQLLKTFEGHADEVLTVAFSPDGRQVLSGAKDKTVKLWDLATAQVVRTFEWYMGEVTSVAFSASGAQVLSGGKDKTLRLWDTATGKQLRTFFGHADEVLFVAFSPDGRQALSGGKDNVLKLWDVETGKPIKTLEGHSHIVTSAVFSADGTQALSGSWDKTLKLWNLADGQPASVIDLQSVKFSPNGHYNLFFGHPIPGTPDLTKLNERLAEKGLKRGDPVFLRVFKGDRQVELWMKRGRQFELFATYPICAWSGQLGPKVQEGDYQSPEGFYTIGNGQLNPNSRYHRAFNLGYPNLLERAHQRTGAHLMMHGSCASIGCFAMTDPVIDELWALVTEALNKGQERVGVHVFPFRMTEERLTAFAWHPWAEFWRDMKPAYDLFESDRVPPQISVCNKRYSAKRGSATAASAPALQAVCPPARGNQQRGRTL